MNAPQINDSRAIGVLRAMVGDSRVCAAARRLRALFRSPSVSSTGTPARAAVENEDTTVLRLADASMCIAALSWPVDRALEAWRSSTAFSIAARWRAMPADIRIRSTAIAIATAIATHLLLTGFSAPEPTGAARAAWLLFLAMSTLIAVRARAVAAAWFDWRRRRASRNVTEVL